MQTKQKRTLKLERFNWERIIERGYGLCSQISLAMYDYFQKNNLNSLILSLGGHVVIEFKDGDKSYILDPDYNVVINGDLNTIYANSDLIQEAYTYAGYNKNVIESLSEIYTSRENNKVVSRYEYYPKLTKFYYLVNLLKWLIPILIIMLIKKMKYPEKRNRILIFLFILIILGISFFFWTKTVQDLKIPADGYFNISFNLINKDIFSLQNPSLEAGATPTMRRAPGYPYFLSGLVNIFNLEELQEQCLLKNECNRFLTFVSFIFSFICILSIIFLFLTCLLLGANYLTSVSVSIIAMIIVSKEIIVNYNSESLALVLFSISSYFLASYRKNTEKKGNYIFINIFRFINSNKKCIFIFCTVFF